MTNEQVENDSDYMSESLTMSDNSTSIGSATTNTPQNDSSMRDEWDDWCACCHECRPMADLEPQRSCEHLICRFCLVEVSLAEQRDGSMCPAPACRCSKRCPSDEGQFVSLKTELDDSDNTNYSEIDLAAIGEMLVGVAVVPTTSDPEMSDARMGLTVFIVDEPDGMRFDEIEVETTTTLGNLKMAIQERWDDWRNGTMYWRASSTCDPQSRGELFQELEVDADEEKTLDQLGISDGAHVVLDVVGDIATRMSLVQH